MTAALLALNARTFASLRRHRNYRLFFTGQVISVSGTWMQNIALAWLVVELTHSPIAVGALAFCRFLPFTIFGLVAGVVADRIDNRKLVITTQSVSMIFSATLALLVLTGSQTLWLVYVLAILSGTALVFDAPGRQALTFQMVGREELPNAVALNASLFNASRVVGPAVAGVLIAAVGVGACFLINTVTFLAVLAGLLLMRKEELVPLQRNGEPPTMMRGIREGFSWVLGQPQMRLVLLIVAVVSTVGFNFHVLLPLLASETLKTGPEVFGILSACFGGGALVGALLSASLGRASWKVLVLGTGGFSISLLALAPLETDWACGVLLFIAGGCFTLWTSNANSILQLNAPDHLRGRVVSLYLWAFAGFAPIGGLLAGWLVDLGGTQLSFTVAGLTGLAMTLVTARQLSACGGRRRRRRTLQRPDTCRGAASRRAPLRSPGDSRPSRSPTRQEAGRRLTLRGRIGCELRLRRCDGIGARDDSLDRSLVLDGALGVLGLDSPRGWRVRYVVGSGHATKTTAPRSNRQGSSPARRRFRGGATHTPLHTSNQACANS